MKRKYKDLYAFNAEWPEIAGDQNTWKEAEETLPSINWAS